MNNIISEYSLDQAVIGERSKDLFKMVYDWGRVGIVVDYHAPAFQSELKKLLCAHTKTINIGDSEHEVWACVECEHILDNNMAVL